MSGSMCEYTLSSLVYCLCTDHTQLSFHVLSFVQALDDDHLGNTESARKKGLGSVALNLCACVSLLMLLPAIILITVNIR